MTNEATVDSLFALDHEGISQAGRSFVLSHGRKTARAAVLFHGLSATPKQFAEFAQLLFERGYNVLVPRLPRHGFADRMSEELAHLEPGELKDLANNAVEIAQTLGDHVSLVGFSLGGLVTAWAAQFHRVDLAICIAPFFGVAWIPNRFSHAIAHMFLRMPNRFHWWDPIKKEKLMPEHGYPRYATHAVAHAYMLARDVLEDARNHTPRASKVVLVTNPRETTVSNKAIRELLKRWKTSAADRVEHYQLQDLPISHDVIEPLRRRDVVDKVYPQLLQLLERYGAD